MKYFLYSVFFKETIAMSFEWLTTPHIPTVEFNKGSELTPNSSTSVFKMKKIV